MLNYRAALVIGGLAVFGLAVLVFGPLRQAGIFDFARKGAEQASQQAAAEKRDVAEPAKPSQQAAQNPAQNGSLNSSLGEGERQTAAQQARKSPREEGQEVPAFDVVRVEPDGESVVAGRAAPGATVELLRNGIVHGRTVADAAGLFAMTPDRLPQGDHQLTLRFLAPDGQRKVSKESVAVSLAQKRKEPVVVALSAPDRPTVVLSSPAKSSGPGSGADQKAGDNARSLSSAVVIETAEGSEGGKLFVSGRAAPGGTVRLYLNDSYLASGIASKDGRLSFSIASGVVPGDYRIRLDHVDPASGAVKSRAEVPFNLPARQVAAAPSGAAVASAERAREEQAETTRGLKEAAAKPSDEKAAPVVVVPEVRTAIVVRGESLWRISQRIYGEGVRYTVIYSANTDQIRNPHLIYPGQTFVLPNQQKN